MSTAPPAIFPSNSAEWPRQREAIEARILELHVELEQPNDETLHNITRGQIMALRWIIQSAEPQFAPGKGSASYA